MNGVSLLKGLYDTNITQSSKSGNVSQKSFQEFEAQFDSFIKSGKYEENDYEDFLKNNNIDATKENVKKLKDCVEYVNENDDEDIENAAASADNEDVDVNKLEIDQTADIISRYKSYEKGYDALRTAQYYENNTQTAKSLTFEQYALENPEIYSNLYKYKIVKALISNGMAVTESNISLVENADKKLDDIMENFSGENALEAVKSGEINIENLYKSKHINAQYHKKMSDSQWESLEGEADKLFERENIENTQENKDTARLFIDEEIPVTKENIDAFNMLTNNKIDKDAVIDNIAKAISYNKDPEKADICTNTSDNGLIEKYERTSEVIKNVETAHLQYMYEHTVPYTLENIQGTYENNEVSQAEPEQEALQAKIKLAQIQLKLTKEAAARLAGKDIDINTEPLEKAIDELKQIEKEIYSEKLSTMGTEPTNENVQTTAKVFDTFTNFSVIKQNGLEVPYSYNSGKILGTLDALSTAVNQKLGDSFASVSNQFEGLLESLDIEPTKENINAAKILSKNDIEVNYENITEIKTMNTKVSTLCSGFSPYAAAKMIKDGINPLETSIDDMLEYMDNFDEQYYMTDIEKTAQYIVDLNSDSEYTDEQKTAVTAFYRALSTASKYGFASIGNALGTRKLTVGELMDAAKSFEKIKRSDIDFKVDDDTQVVNAESEIKMQVSAAAENSESTASSDFYDALVKNIISSGNPSALKELSKDGELSEKTLEEISLGLSETDKPSYISDSKLQNLKENIAQMKNITEDVVAWLKENNVPLTINNLNNMAQFLSDSQTAGKKLDKLNKDLSEKNISSVSEIKKIEENEPSEISEAVVNMTDDILNDVIQSEQDIDVLYKQIEGVKNMYELQKNINESSGNIFQIPYKKENGDITSLNMYVSDSIGESFNAFVSLETQNIGTVNAYINFSEDGADIVISSENDLNTQYLSDMEDEFREEFAEFNIKSISFETGESKNIFDMK